MNALAPWMRLVLRLAALNNVLAGVGMIIFYHEAFKLLGVPKPELNLPIQLVGVLVLLFGIGYWWAASDPVANRNVLLLGTWSKLLGSVLGVYYVARGDLPAVFLALLLVADVVYLPLFYAILRRVDATGQPTRRTVTTTSASPEPVQSAA